jgi:hypothetical protein
LHFAAEDNAPAEVQFHERVAADVDDVLGLPQVAVPVDDFRERNPELLSHAIIHRLPA